MSPLASAFVFSLLIGACLASLVASLSAPRCRDSARFSCSSCHGYFTRVCIELRSVSIIDSVMVRKSEIVSPLVSSTPLTSLPKTIWRTS
jgi:hypothetical protein